MQDKHASGNVNSSPLTPSVRDDHTQDDFRRVFLLDNNFSVKLLSKRRIFSWSDLQELEKSNEKALVRIQFDQRTYRGPYSKSCDVRDDIFSWREMHEADDWKFQTIMRSCNDDEVQLATDGKNVFNLRAHEDAEHVIDITTPSQTDTGVTKTTLTAPDQLAKLNVVLLLTMIFQIPCTLLLMAVVDWSSRLFQTGCAIGIVLGSSLVFYFGR